MKQTNEASITAAVTDDLRTKIRASFFMMLQSAAELESGDTDTLSDFEDMCRAVIRMAEETADTASPLDETEKQARRELLTDFRHQIIKAFRRLNTLRAYLHLADDWVKQSVLLMAANEAPPQRSGNDLFYRHLDSLTGKNDTLDMETLSMCMSYIPLRMTTARYSDYVKAAFRHMHQNVRGEHPDDFKQLFNPMDELKNGTGYQSLKQTLDDVWLSDLDKHEIEEKQVARARVDETREKLVQAFGQLCTLFDTVNALYIVNCCDGSLAEKIPDALSFKEARPSEEQLDEAVHKAVDAIKYGPLENVFEEMYGHDPVRIPETLHPLYDTWSRVHMLFYESGLDYFTIPRVKSVSDDGEDTLYAFIAEILPYMEERVSALPVKRKRFLRQHFLKYLPYPYDLDAYKQYFLDTYESLDNTSRALMFLYMTNIDPDVEGSE